VLLTNNPFENLVRRPIKKIGELTSDCQKNSLEEKEFTTPFKTNTGVGDQCYFLKIFFNLRSQLTESSQSELDRIVKILEKKKILSLKSLAMFAVRLAIVTL
jgi:hypothetical protein